MSSKNDANTSKSLREKLILKFYVIMAGRYGKNLKIITRKSKPSYFSLMFSSKFTNKSEQKTDFA